MQLELPILTRVTLQPDGTYSLRPVVVPDTNGETWVDTRHACQVFGWVWDGAARKRIWKLGDSGLIAVRKPTPRRTEYELGSLLRHKAATADPEFWEQNRTARESFRPA